MARNRLFVAATLAVFLAPFISMKANAWSPTIFCPGRILVVSTVGLAPFIYLHAAGHDGYFAVDTGSPDSVIDFRAVERLPGDQITIEDLSFPYVSVARFFVSDLSGVDAPDGKPLLGLIGDDILKLTSVQFQYDPDDIHRYLVVAPFSCYNKLHNDPHLFEISQKGHFFYKPQNAPLLPQTPVIFGNIGPLNAAIGIDTGNANMTGAMTYIGNLIHSVPNIVYVNRPFFQLLRQNHLPLRPMHLDRAQILSPHACLSPRRDIYPTYWWLGMPTQFSTSHVTKDSPGERMFNIGNTIISTLPNACGDLGSSTVPIAMIGAVPLAAWSTTIVDGLSGHVWVGRSLRTRSVVLGPDDARAQAMYTLRLEEDPYAGTVPDKQLIPDVQKWDMFQTIAKDRALSEMAQKGQIQIGVSPKRWLAAIDDEERACLVANAVANDCDAAVRERNELAKESLP